MFIIELYVNELLIKQIEVLNTGRTECDGYTRYEILGTDLLKGFTRSKYIWHKRKDGAMKLARLVLNRLKGTDT